MRKISTLLMLFCAFVGTAWAAATDLPELSTEGDIKWYTLKNVRKQKFATYAGDNATMTQQATANAASFFYFTASTTEGAVKIHNYAAGDKLCAAYNSWTEAGIDWYLKAQSTGVSICTSTGEWNAWNDAGGGGQKVEYWSASDAGSAWEFTLVTDFSAIIDVPAAKTAAIAEIENYATVSTIYPNATTTVEAINAVNAADNSLAGLNAAVEAINAKVVEYKKSAYEALSGKYFSIQTPTRGNGYMEMATSKVVGTATLASAAGLWQFVSNNDGTLKVFNPYTGKYLCEPQGNSAAVAVTTDANNAGSYTLAVNSTNPANQDAKIKFTSNGKSVHMDGSSNLVRWDNGGASEWAVIEVADFSALIEAYKTSTISTLDSWATLSVVFDASLIATAKTNINAINTNSFATFAALDAELTKVTDAVAAKMFTFQTLATDSHRENVWVSANASTGKAIGAHTAEPDYNAIWSLRHAGGVSFYIYNELTSKYMGKPSGNAALTDTPVDAYTFEIIDAANGVVEFKCGGETLHASNHDDDKLLSWDGDEAASRWYIRTIDIAADIQAILDGLTADDYAEVPALGQYPKTAYDALVAARTNAKTVEEVNAAIVAFNKAKNVPVYFITSAWDEGYPAGKAILYNGSAWRFDTANKFNRQMWMTIPEYTNADVPTVAAYDAEGTSYGICDYLTSTLMRDKKVQIVAIEGWEGAYNLQYNADATSTDAAQHAQQGGALVNWKPATVNDCQASAWRVEYLGSSYELDQLTDEKIAEISEALATLEAANNFEPAFGETVGYYAHNDAYATAKAAAAAILNKSVVELAATSVEEFVAAAEAINASLSIVTPDANKYYVVESASTNDYCAGQMIYVGKEGYMGFHAEDVMANVFQFVPATDGKFYLVNVETGSALSTAKAANDGAQAAHTALYDVEPVAVSISNMGSKNIVKLVPDGGPMIHAQNDGSAVVGWNNHSYEGASAWYIKEVNIEDYAHNVTVTAAEWATLVLGYNAAIPEGVTAYAVSSVDAESATLTPVEGVLPANTPVLLNAPANDYAFVLSTETPAVVENNVLDGCTIDRHVYEDCYVLGNGSAGVGFYKAKKNVNADDSNDIVEGEGEDAVTTPTYEAVLSNAFKAYLPANGVAAHALRFNFGGTTAIESVVNGINANAAIYDLSGRRVEKATKGIYIVNGKKMIVK